MRSLGLRINTIYANSLSARTREVLCLLARVTYETEKVRITDVQNLCPGLLLSPVVYF